MTPPSLEPDDGPRAAGSESTDPVTELVRQHQAMVWRYLRLLGCDAESAEELTQEAFVLWFRAGHVDQGPASTAAWLRRTAKNLWRNHARRRVRGGVGRRADIVWEEIAGPDGQAQGFTDAVERCLGELAPRARAAVLASRVEERSREDIAAELGLRVEGVKTLLRRAVAALRECLERRIGDVRDRKNA